MIYFAGVLFLLGLSLIAWIRHDGKDAGRSEAKTEEADHEKENALKQAQSWADAPGTDSDFHNRMRERIQRGDS